MSEPDHLVGQHCPRIAERTGRKVACLSPQASVREKSDPTGHTCLANVA